VGIEECTNLRPSILLDDDMRIKITDFGSAKLLDKDGNQPDSEGRKRSFVGSADFVSPEVLRNEPAVPSLVPLSSLYLKYPA